MGLFVYTQKGSIISMVDLPTTEIIEPEKGLQTLLEPFFNIFKLCQVFFLTPLGFML